MKPRSEGFLWDGAISHDSEQFDYIRELHDYLWRFVRTIKPGAIGYLGDYLDEAIRLAEGRLGEPVQTSTGVPFDLIRSIHGVAETDEAACVQSIFTLLRQRRMMAKAVVVNHRRDDCKNLLELYEHINQQIRLVMGL